MRLQQNQNCMHIQPTALNGMMLSSNAVRRHHRSSSNSPNESHQPSTYLTVDPDSDIVGNGRLNITESADKLHGFRRRRDELLRSRKQLLVLGGAVSVLALCLVGMWASSTSIDGGRGARQLDRRGPPSTSTRHHKIMGRKKRPPRGIGHHKIKDEEHFMNPKKSPDETVRTHNRKPYTDRRKVDVDRVKRKDIDEDRPRKILKKRPVEKSPDNHKSPTNNIEIGGVSDKESVHERESDKKGRIFHNEPRAAAKVREMVHEKRKERAAAAGQKDTREVMKEETHKKSKHDSDEDHANDEERMQGVGSEEDEGNYVPASSVPRPIKEVDIKLWGYQSRPRVLRLHLDKGSVDKQKSGGESDDTGDDLPQIHHKNFILSKVDPIPTHESKDIPSSDRFVTPYPDDDDYIDRVENVKKSKKYRRNEREPLEDKECKPRHKWQEGAFPNCNVLHEYELGKLSGVFGRALRKKLKKNEGDGDELVKYLAHGYWRDVWLLSKASGSFETKYHDRDDSSEFDEEITVLKTLRYRHDFTDRNYDRHRKDALASERLSKSPNVVDIFAYCSNSAVFEYGPGGDIDAKLWPYDDEEEKYYVAEISSFDKLDMAYQVARSIADTHDVEGDGYASIAHTDITPSQYIFINGRWKLNDFNRCRFMRQYKEDNKPCGFYVGANPGKFRSPEEYNYEEENEMIDIYSMGNIFYAILTGEMPFEGQKDSKAQKKVIDGERPTGMEKYEEDDDVAIRALISATKKCWEQEPGDRPSAASVRDVFKEVLDQMKVDNENATKEESKDESREESKEESEEESKEEES